MNKYIASIKQPRIMGRYLRNAYCHACARASRVRRLAPAPAPAPAHPCRIALHTVFIPRENILFMRDWIEYYRLLGVTEFHLYNNGAVQVADGRRAHNPYFIPGQVGKYGTRYGELVDIDDDEINRIMREIQDDIPGVHIHPWNPVTRSGRVIYAQVGANNHARIALADSTDWILSVDMDEFIVMPEGQNLQTLCAQLSASSMDAAYFPQVRMADRWWFPERHLLRNNLMLKASNPSYFGAWNGKKFIYRPSQVSAVGVHKVIGANHIYWLRQKDAIMLHYNVPKDWYDDDQFTPCSYTPPKELMNKLQAH